MHTLDLHNVTFFDHFILNQNLKESNKGTAP